MECGSYSGLTACGTERQQVGVVTGGLNRGGGRGGGGGTARVHIRCTTCLFRNVFERVPSCTGQIRF